MKLKLFLPLLYIGLSFLPVNAQIPELDWPLEIVSEGHGFTEGASLAPDGRIFFSDMDKLYKASLLPMVKPYISPPIES